LASSDTLHLIRNVFDDSAYVLRAEREPDEKFGCFGVCVLIVCLIVLFLLIWFVMKKVLLLEVENQISHESAIRVGGGPIRFVRHAS
jgi:hypothetical protein